VLQYVHTQFGAQPQITNVMRGADGNSLAVIFTVTSASTGSQQIAGLALVAVSAAGPGQGAVLTDEAGRFRSTVGPMLKRLQSGAGLQTAGSSSAATGSNVPGSAAAAAVSPPPAADSSAPASARAGHGSAAVALQETAFPDGSGSVALPVGWTLTGAHAGEVTAQGPGSAGLHFDWQISVIDPNDPRSRGSRLGNPIAIPHGTDSASAYKSVMTQIYQKQGKTPPSIEVLESNSVSAQESVLSVNMGAIEGRGPVRLLVDMGVSPLNQLGGYLITLYVIGFPQELGAQSQATAVAILHSYKVNQTVAVAQIHGDAQRSQAITEATLVRMQRGQDAQDRQFQAFDNGLLDRTVIRDADLNAHGTVSNDLANALVQANPGRFQEVPPSEFVKGIDY
jgi:hypothetical protein